MLSKDVACIQPQHLSAMHIQFSSVNIEDKAVIDSPWAGYVILLSVSIFFSLMAVIIPNACFLAAMTETGSTALSLLSGITILIPITFSILNCYQVSVKTFGMQKYIIPSTVISSTLLFFHYLI